MMRTVGNIFCTQKLGSECGCNCTCVTCRNNLSKYNQGMANYFLEQLMADPALVESYLATRVGNWHTDKSLAATVYLKEYGEN